VINQLKIGDRIIGSGYPVFIIAEVGINHEGDLIKCERMVTDAAEAKVDAVKLQTIDADANYVRGSSSYDVFKKAELSENETKVVFDLAKSLNLEIFTTVGDLETFEWVKKFKPCAWKISSGLINHLPLIDEISKLNQPMILSTGLSDYDEISEAVDVIRNNGNDKIVILQCTSLYPLEYHNVFLSRMKKFKESFSLNVGYSDHCVNNDAAFLSVGAGAVMIEKHFTYKKEQKGFDHNISLDKVGLIKFVDQIRLAESIMCKEEMKPKEFMREQRNKNLRCIVARKVILKGDEFTLDNISIKRSSGNKLGLSPKYFYNILGRTAEENYDVDDPISN